MAKREGEKAEHRPYRLLGRLGLVGSLLFVLCALLRFGLLERQGLWADELFSLALATGHSLEHPADKAEPALGDYVELPRAVPPSAYSCYLEHETPAVHPGRVIRAVFLSDTNPPLYYVLLHGWTRLLGCSEAALRLFSLVCGLASFPVVWSLAKQVAGRTALVPTCTVFTFSPLCVYYTTEGRMYALLCFWAVSVMWLTLRLWRRGPRPLLYGLWIVVSAAGLLTHYFFAFIWIAAIAWLWAHPRSGKGDCPSYPARDSSLFRTEDIAQTGDGSGLLRSIAHSPLVHASARNFDELARHGRLVERTAGRLQPRHGISFAPLELSFHPRTLGHFPVDGRPQCGAVLRFRCGSLPNTFLETLHRKASAGLVLAVGRVVGPGGVRLTARELRHSRPPLRTGRHAGCIPARRLGPEPATNDAPHHVPDTHRAGVLGRHPPHLRQREPAF